MTMSREPERLRQLQTKMASAEVDLTAIGPTVNMHYLLGFTPLAVERPCILLVSLEDKCLISPTLHAAEMQEHTGLETIDWTDAEGPTQAIAKGLDVLGIPKGSTLAVDETMRADALLLLQEIARPGKSISVSPVMSALRMCKSEAEVEALARSAAQADRALKVGAEACLPGATEREVANRIAAYFLQDGAETIDFTIVGTGPNGASPHHHPGDRRLQPGDTVVIDIGATLDSYKSDVTRMVHLGQPPAEVCTIYQAVKEANLRARQAIKPGVLARTVDRAARDSLKEAGYASYFIHRTGHGIGLETHEPPYITPDSDIILEPGMSFSVEPGVYLQGKFGIRIEDIMVVTEDGCRCLTGLDHELIVNI